MNNWKYKLQKDFDFTVDHKIQSSKIWLRDGERVLGYAGYRKDTLSYIRVFEGYAWDGASPKFSVLDLFWIGTPDGCLYEGFPKLYRATLIHDSLLQFRNQLGLTRKQCDDRFLEEMKKNKFKLRWIYYWAVRIYAILTGK